MLFAFLRFQSAAFRKKSAALVKISAALVKISAALFFARFFLFSQLLSVRWARVLSRPDFQAMLAFPLLPETAHAGVGYKGGS